MRFLLFFLSLSFLLLMTPSMYAGVYKWTDSEGNTHYGDKPPAEHPDPEEFVIEDRAPPAQDATSGMRDSEWRLLEYFERKRERTINAHRARAAKLDSKSRQHEKIAEKQQKKCDSYREQEEKVSWKLRTGYSLGQGSKLRRQQRNYADKISRDCQ